MQGWTYNGGTLVCENQGYVPSTNNWFEVGASNNVKVSVNEGTCPTILPLNAKISKTDSSCNNNQNCNGNITVAASGGVPPYLYSVNGGATYQTLNSFNNLCPQIYSVILKDSANTTVTNSVTVGSSGTLTSYTIQAYNISTQALNVNTKTNTWGIQVTPSIPVGTTITFNINVNSTTYINTPGSGTSNPSTVVYKNNIPQTQTNTSTTTNTTNRANCAPYTTQTTNKVETYTLTMTYGDVITGLTTSNITGDLSA